MGSPLEILTVAEMAEADRLAITSGTTGYRLMEAAGAAVAKACLRHLGAGRGRRVLVLCGPGNNGGDGFVAARRLREAGHVVALAALGDVSALQGDARLAAERWPGPASRLEEVDWRDTDLVVDALFGTGLARPIEGVAAEALTRLAAVRVPVIAIDVPSGIHGDTGQVLSNAVHATETVTFFRLKPAHWLLPGRHHCGVVTLADIGIMDDVLGEISPLTSANKPAAWRSCFPEPKSSGHKYSRGHVLVVSGPMPTLGAARLAARGAARIGAGLVTVASPHDAVEAHAAHLTSIMLRPFDGQDGLAEMLADSRKNAVVLGPGLGVGPETWALVEAALRPNSDGHGRAVVLDADALTSFSGDAAGLGLLIAGANGPVVATPHDGEFARLFSASGEDVRSPSKLERARSGAKILGATLILKGDDSVVASPDGRASIGSADAPWLATAGSGDVLAGMIGGLLAQEMPVFQAVSAAVWLHAAAARSFGLGLISEDLPEMLPLVLRDLLAR